ncbi:MAG: (Fe-S)-binding protein [Acidobacteriaceae bacterium]|nr:(Fe-S)-binding protein [Acidobacteriaceae bacterium]
MPTVSLFIPCFVDQLVPQVGIDTAEVLERIGYRVRFPEAQTCCGQPAFNTGYWDEARDVAERFVRIFADSEYIVSPSGSCTTMVREFYRELLKDTPMLTQAVSVGERTYELAEFLVKVAKVTDVGSTFPHKVTYHDSCHGLRELGLKREGRELLRHVRGLELVDLPYSEECCGFGGTFAVKFPMISAAMGDTKAGHIDATGAEFVTASDPSCLLHIEGVLRKRNSRAQTIHLASILAQTATASSSAKGAAR